MSAPVPRARAARISGRIAWFSTRRQGGTVELGVADDSA